MIDREKATFVALSLCRFVALSLCRFVGLSDSLCWTFLLVAARSVLSSSSSASWLHNEMRPSLNGNCLTLRNEGTFNKLLGF